MTGLETLDLRGIDTTVFPPVDKLPLLQVQDTKPLTLSICGCVCLLRVTFGLKKRGNLECRSSITVSPYKNPDTFLSSCVLFQRSLFRS